MTDVLADDRKARRSCDILGRTTDVREGVPHHQRVNRAIQRCSRHFEQVRRLVVNVTDGDGNGRVRVPAVDDRSAVERDHVALVQHGVIGDSVHHHRVG
jgi:hypothetical protein